MDTALKVVKMIALLSVAFVCSVVGYEALQVRPVVTQLSMTLQKADGEIDDLHATNLLVNSTVVSVNTAAASANALLLSAKKTVDTVNQKQGILTMVYKDLNDFRTSLDIFNRTAIDEQHYLEVEQPGITAQMRSTLGHADELIQSGTKIVSDADTTMPLLKASLTSLDDATAAAVPAIKSVAKIAQDGADETHRLVHPDKKKLTFWSALDGGTLWVHSHLLPPLF